MSAYPKIYALLRRLLAERGNVDSVSAETLLADALRSNDDWTAVRQGIYRDLGLYVSIDELKTYKTVRDLAHHIHSCTEREAASEQLRRQFSSDQVKAAEKSRSGSDEGQLYTTVRVYYATDREATSADAKVPYYGPRRGNGELTLGSAEVSIPRNHKYGELEGPKWWQIFQSPDPAKHIVVLSAGELVDEEFWSQVRTCVAASDDRDALVLVHGYNVTFEQGLRRAAQVVYDLRFPGAPILYSWPSHGSTTSYPADEANVEWTVPHFRAFLRSTLEATGARRVHVIAHSMGNRAVVRAVRELDLDSLKPGAAELRQLVLAAPDIDAGTFRQLAAEFASKAERCTMYVNSEDRALALSDKIHGSYPRAGGGGDDLVVVSGVDTIDATHHATDFLSHSYFAGSSPVVSDLFDIIRNETPPGRRARLLPEQHSGLDYWRFAT